ncbi:MAG TPA: sigma-70 family RNA polymerase sigma factor, partial [Verrucomicrobiae bacterium]
MQTDAELLADYADRQSESAFAELVQRHVALVYSSALRQVGHSHQAQEITQAVFILLARKAGQLQRDTVLAGWLCRSAHLIARDQLKMEHRRQQREHTAYLEAAMDTPEPETQAAWQQLAPYLDEAIANLSETDRAALILRYFENRPWQEVAGLLQVTEDAAQKRAARALEKLRQLFTKRGVALTGTAIASAVTVNAVQAAPAGLGVTIATAALAGTTTSAAAVLAATTKTIAMTTLQKTLILATLTGFVGAGLYEARQAAQLRGQVQTLQQTQAPLAAQIRSLQNSLADATNRLADLMGENRRLQANVTSPELLKLRGEVTRLNQQLLAKTADPSQEPADPTVQTAKVLAERIKLLKENYAHWQGKTTAE